MHRRLSRISRQTNESLENDTSDSGCDSPPRKRKKQTGRSWCGGFCRVIRQSCRGCALLVVLFVFLPWAIANLVDLLVIGTPHATLTHIYEHIILDWLTPPVTHAPSERELSHAEAFLRDWGR